MVVILAIGIPLVTLLGMAIEADNAEFRAGIETLSCPEIKFLIQYGNYEHTGDDIILEVWVDKC